MLSHATLHDAAALILVIGGAAFVGLAFRRRRADRAGATTRIPTPPASIPARPLGAILAGLSVGAGAIHLAAAPHHSREIGEVGAGFLVAGLFQLAWARAWLVGPSPRLALVGILGTVAILGAWALTRTIGLGVAGLGAGPERIGLPDGAATVFEVLLLAGLAGGRTRIGAIAAGSRPVRLLAPIAVIPVIGLVIVVSSLSLVAIAAGLDHGLPAGTALPEHAALH